LHDSISTKEIADSYQQALAKQKIYLPFTVTIADTNSARKRELPDLEENKVMVGFLNPRTFQLNFINTGWHIFKQMWQQILISLLLVGITTASFLLLYRNLIRQQRLTQLKNDFISNKPMN